jgi:hypothetical protein
MPGKTIASSRPAGVSRKAPTVGDVPDRLARGDLPLPREGDLADPLDELALAGLVDHDLAVDQVRARVRRERPAEAQGAAEVRDVGEPAGADVVGGRRAAPADVDVALAVDLEDAEAGQVQALLVAVEHPGAGLMPLGVDGAAEEHSAGRDPA